MKSLKTILLVSVLLLLLAGCTQSEKKVEGTQAVQEPKTETNTAQAKTTQSAPQNVDIAGSEPTSPASIILTDLAGEQIDLKNFGGKMMILDFWATHCPPCKQEMPIFNKLYKKYRDQGLVIVAVSLDRGRAQAKVQPFIDDYGLEFHVGYPTQEIMMEWGRSIRYIPTTYVIDSEGKILERVVGGKPESFWQGYIDKLVLKDAV